MDLNGGSYLVLSAQTPIARYFGDPCPGYVKDLYIMYDIDGRVGSVCQQEINGELLCVAVLCRVCVSVRSCVLTQSV